MKMNQYNIKSKMFDFGLILGGSFIPSWSVILGLTTLGHTSKITDQRT